VSPSGDANRNVIVWMDHRAAGEADEINAGRHDVLRYVGGVISPEMETPKLLWLKRNLPQSFAAAAHFFDLADYLTWRATGSLARSMCTVTCKWTYLAHEQRWDAAYFRAIGLGACRRGLRPHRHRGRHARHPAWPWACRRWQRAISAWRREPRSARH
jgi:D-ribulokinase